MSRGEQHCCCAMAGCARTRNPKHIFKIPPPHTHAHTHTEQASQKINTECGAQEHIELSPCITTSSSSGLPTCVSPMQGHRRTVLPVHTPLLAWPRLEEAKL